MVKQLRGPGHVQPVGRPGGTCMYYAMRDVKDNNNNNRRLVTLADVKDMGQQSGYRSPTGRKKP